MSNKPKIHARIYKDIPSVALFFPIPMPWCIEIQYPDRIDYRYAKSWTIAMAYVNTLIEARSSADRTIARDKEIKRDLTYRCSPLGDNYTAYYPQSCMVCDRKH